MNKYILIGNKGVGKTTLATKIIKNTNKNICGLFTKKIDSLIDDNGMWPIYLYSAKEELVIDDNHLVGRCGRGKHYCNEDIFNILGVNLISPKDDRELIIIDEVGFLEMDCKQYVDKIIEILKSKNPVVLFFKTKTSEDFLKRVNSIEGINYIYLDNNNRDKVYEELIENINGIV